MLKVYTPKDANNGRNFQKQCITMDICDVTMAANRGRHILECKPLRPQYRHIGFKIVQYPVFTLQYR